MKAVSKKLFSLMLVAILLVSAVPFQVSATEMEPAATETEAPVIETEAPVVVVAEEEEQEVIATSPAVDAGVPLEKGIVHVHFQLDSTSTDYTVGSNWLVGNVVRTRMGAPAVPISGALALRKLAEATGSSDGYEFVRWEYEEGGVRKTYNNKVTLNENMDTNGDVDELGNPIEVLDVYAVIRPAAKNIFLKANGGVLSNNKHSVQVGQQYDFYNVLPTPSREHYTFAGWAKEDGTPVDNTAQVTDLSALVAQWTPKYYTVYYQAYLDETGSDHSGWTDVMQVSVEANSVLSSKYNTFPTAAEINANFMSPGMKADGWYIDGWILAQENRNFEEGKSKIVQDVTLRPIYKKSITLFACDEGNTTRKLTVRLGMNIGTLPNPGSREKYAFVGWCVDSPDPANLICLKEDLANVSKHPVYYPAMGDLYAAWDNSVVIYLYIHTDGNFKDHTKLVRYYDAPASGFNLKDVDLSDIFASYGKYDDEGDIQHGWFSPAQWKSYCLDPDTFKNQTTEYIPMDVLDDDDVHEYYIMLTDKGNNTATSGPSGAGSGYNDSSKVDPTNPSTGDNIGMTMTVMTVSAAALVLVFFLNKKRAIV